MGKSKDAVAALQALGAEIRRLRWAERHWRRAWRHESGERHKLNEQMWEMQHYLDAMEHCPKCGSRVVRWELMMSDLGPDREVVLSCAACDWVWQRTGFASFWGGIKDVLDLAAEEAEEEEGGN